MIWLSLIPIAAALAAASFGAVHFEHRRRAHAMRRRGKVSRIAFPFAGESLSEPALLAALRIAHAEDATLVPVYLALVPRRLALDVPLQAECAVALPLLEAVEQRATRAGVAVDARIERSRTVRQGLRELMAHERFGQMVVAAGASEYDEGLPPEDIAWLLAHAPGELVVLRPASAHRQGASRAVEPIVLGASI